MSKPGAAVAKSAFQVKRKKRRAPTIQVTDRRVECLELRRQGLLYSQIAAKLGVSEGTAWRHVQQGIAAIIAEPAKAVLAIELQRLDTMFQPQYEKATELGDGQACVSCLRIMERRAKLLGLDVQERSQAGAAMGLAPNAPREEAIRVARAFLASLEHQEEAEPDQ